MTLEVVTFWALAILLVGSALAVVLTKNLFHSVLYLALSLTATAGIFLALDAEFLAAVQLLLYAGGVVTIAVFARRVASARRAIRIEPIAQLGRSREHADARVEIGQRIAGREGDRVTRAVELEPHTGRHGRRRAAGQEVLRRTQG